MTHLPQYSGFVCSVCGEFYGKNSVQYVCPRDGGNLDVLLDYENIKKRYRPEDIFIQKNNSMWRYLPLLPVNDPGWEETPLRSVGWTPTYQNRLLSESLGLKNLWIKDEGRNPTASLKDRASALVVARAMELQAEVIVTASTGNAGAALAGMAAAVGQKAVIFAPKTAPPAKVAQLLVFGAKVVLVDGNYDQAFDLSLQASSEFGWYCRNTGFNPFTLEGKKTAALEIWENQIIGCHLQEKPLSIFVSVGDGNIISGLHKGFKDLVQLGWLDNAPRLFGIQAEGSAAVANAYFNHSEVINPVSANTIADSISVDFPRDGVRAVRAAHQTGGEYLTVSDTEILKSIKELGRYGIFAEPAGAASYAGLKKAVHAKIIKSDDPVLILVTGNGLKDIKAANLAVEPAPIIEPSMAALKELMNTGNF